MMSMNEYITKVLNFEWRSVDELQYYLLEVGKNIENGSLQAEPDDMEMLDRHLRSSLCFPETKNYLRYLICHISLQQKNYSEAEAALRAISSGSWVYPLVGDQFKNLADGYLSQRVPEAQKVLSLVRKGNRDAMKQLSRAIDIVMADRVFNKNIVELYRHACETGSKEGMELMFCTANGYFFRKKDRTQQDAKTTLLRKKHEEDIVLIYQMLDQCGGTFLSEKMCEIIDAQARKSFFTQSELDELFDYINFFHSVSERSFSGANGYRRFVDKSYSFYAYVIERSTNKAIIAMERLMASAYIEAKNEDPERLLYLYKVILVSGNKSKLNSAKKNEMLGLVMQQLTKLAASFYVKNAYPEMLHVYEFIMEQGHNKMLPQERQYFVEKFRDIAHQYSRGSNMDYDKAVPFYKMMMIYGQSTEAQASLEELLRLYQYRNDAARAENIEDFFAQHVIEPSYVIIQREQKPISIGYKYHDTARFFPNPTSRETGYVKGHILPDNHLLKDASINNANRERTRSDTTNESMASSGSSDRSVGRSFGRIKSPL